MKYEPLLLRFWEVPASDLCLKTDYSTEILWYYSVLLEDIIKIS